MTVDLLAGASSNKVSDWQATDWPKARRYGVGENKEPSREDWLICKVEDQKFKAFGDPFKLQEMIGIFLDWAAKKGEQGAVGENRMSGETFHWGLAGVGRHGNMSAELDEPVGREGPWNLELSGPQWSFRFDVAGGDAVRSLLAFVRKHGGKPGYERHEISKSQEVLVEMTKTSDHGVRFELRVCTPGCTVSGTIQDDDVNSLQKALEGVLQDLDT